MYAIRSYYVIEDELTFADEIELLMEIMDEIFETFVISGYLSGLFKMPNFWDRKYEYFEHQWIKAPKKWIDPLKETNANRIAMQTGQKTFKQIAAENGHDWKDQIDEMNEVLEYAHERGVEMGGVLFGKTKEELYGSGKEQTNQD